MSDWNFLNKHRLKHGRYSSDPSFGFTGAFMFNLAHEVRPVCCIASDEMGWKHISVSFGQRSNRTPTWETMCRVKDLFFEDEDVVIQFHPKKSDYVNNHPGCLHLWMCTDGREQPIPDSVLVGVKDGPVVSNFAFSQGTKL